MRRALHGTWPSPLSARDVASSVLRLSEVSLDGTDIYWLEGRPQEAGRSVLVRRGGDGQLHDVTPPSLNVRSRVHEYGGGAYIVRQGVAYVVNDADQRVYRVPASGAQADARAEVPAALTAPGPHRYADFCVDTRRDRLICVRETHAEGHEPVNALVEVPSVSMETPPVGKILAEGEDFYSSPRLSADGLRLAWLSWRHPSMPWERTELWVAPLDASGELGPAVRVAGGDAESVYQPGWTADGDVNFVSDRDGWWRLYRATRAGDGAWTVQDVLRHPPDNTEFGRPQWVFGTSTWAEATPSRLVVTCTRAGRWHLGVVDTTKGTLEALAARLHPNDWIAADASAAVLVAATDASADALVRVDLGTGAVETLREASSLHVDSGAVSVAEPVSFQTSGGLTAHAFYYPPRNPAYVAPDGDMAPLIVLCHGGPTTAARCSFNPAVQYWTSRGFAVADVNYGGSSGYGRAYRDRLRASWGVVDLDDVVHAARHLAAGRGLDARRVVVRGGSAGGFTALAALAFRPGVFAAGVSYYGICDLELLAHDTHKFESKYLESLVGPYPEAREVYRHRSPIHAADSMKSALLLFQGLEDRVVPPNQSQMMADAVQAAGAPVAYLGFEGEQHGFRRSDTIVRCLEAELYFFGVILGFTPADSVPPIPIHNAPTSMA